MILKFDGDLAKKRFEFCFVGFVLGGSMQDKKGMQVLRTEVGLFEKMEAISELKPCGKKMVNGEPERQLKGDTDLQITLQEYDLLFNYMANVPWQTGTPSKTAVAVLDWLQESHNGRHS